MKHAAAASEAKQAAASGEKTPVLSGAALAAAEEAYAKRKYSSDGEIPLAQKARITQTPPCSPPHRQPDDDDPIEMSPPKKNTEVAASAAAAAPEAETLPPLDESYAPTVPLASSSGAVGKKDNKSSLRDMLLHASPAKDMMFLRERIVVLACQARSAYLHAEANAKRGYISQVSLFTRVEKAANEALAEAVDEFQRVARVSYVDLDAEAFVGQF